MAKKKRHIIKIILLLITLIALLFAAGYTYYIKSATKPVNDTMLSAMRERNNNAWNKDTILSCVKILRSGDLIVRTGIDVTSYGLSRMNALDKTYSHCGLVMIENGYPFIYHSIGGEDNPDATLRRDSVRFFLSPRNNFGFGIVRYDLDTSQIARLSTVVKRYYAEKRKFDLDFDLDTDDKLYCAEFVYKAVNEATKEPYLQPISFFGHKYIGVDNLYMNKHASMICQVKFK
ncbi:MAG: hypothetical protein H0X33_04335 [Taibaiella sp.]|nr:hypothetical protein [Taibaiella sp.]